LYSGDGSVNLHKLLRDRLMPMAHEQNNRWLMTWCHSVLQERHEAAYALIKPLGGIRTWRQDDPTTMILYKELRTSSSVDEYQAVLRAARVLRRMGLWLLALELVHNWTFKPALPPISSSLKTNGVHSDAPLSLDSFASPGHENNQPPSMLDGFTKPSILADDKAAREAKAAELLKRVQAKKSLQSEQTVASEKRQPTQFKEPDANSLLDSFGF
jgi:hypothetical protein